jgi:type I restriction enzyme S subunit
MTTTLTHYCDLIATQVDPHDHGDAVYIGLEHIRSGEFLRSGAGIGREVESSKYAFREGDVLYSKLRPYLDKAILADCNGICTTELLVLRPKPNVDPRFLVCVLHSSRFREHAMSGVTGSQHPRTSWHRISEFELSNFTQTEQENIASFGWEIHGALKSNRNALDTFLELKEAAMKELFTCGLRGERQKQTEVGSIPHSWNVVLLGSLGRIGNGSTPKRDVSEYWKDGVYPWLTSAKVYDRQITTADEFVTNEALVRCHLPRVKAGSLLIAITGQGKTLGNCAILDIEATINQHLAYVLMDSDQVSASYIRGYVETLYDYLRDVASGGGSTKAALTCAFLRDLPIPLPPTLKEQREIAAVLDVIDQKIGLHQRKKRVLQELSQQLLNDFITGGAAVGSPVMEASA